MLSGLQRSMPRANVARMIKRILAVLSLFVIAIPSLAAAQGVTSSADPRATEAGREILMKGGSAADAEMAMMLVLTLVEPQSSGIGGGGFFLYHDAKTGTIATIDGREKAPAAATPERFLDKDGKPRGFMDVVPGGLSVGVPGNIRLMEEVHKRWGKLAWADIFQPAIDLADKGFKVTPVLHRFMTLYADVWKDFPELRAIYYVDGKPAPVGTVIRNPAYAKLLRDIAARGPDAFYTGANAQAIVAAVTRAPRNPAKMTLADLKAYRAKERPAVCTTYRIYKVCGMAPPSSGATTVQGILGMLEAYDMKAMGKDNVMSWHLLAEAMQLAYADRGQYLGDSDFVDVPVKGLLDKQYLASRRMLISPYSVRSDYPAGSPPGAEPRTPTGPVAEHGTTHFVAVDRDGNVATMTSTVESIFGSQLVANGYILNNELTDFTFVPEKDGKPVANRVEANKRPLSSMSPTIVYGPDGKLILALGSAGGKRIIMHVTKTLIGVLDWGLSAEDAIALPNLYFDNQGAIIEDNAMGQRIAKESAVFGKPIRPEDFGSKVNAIERTPAGWRGAADPRTPGTWATDDPSAAAE
ncbi:gamma-glutamyltransferase 1 Threonine peptidase. MEROPS family T03 [Sphingopyxis indica]|uniref:Glutathione hydrolase proenzyme n=2 Tax=Sphingopyxis indica TaxID=436663 RepID=A0A239LF91_9SPHN|nr:gamma-glutamyltransferase 1 Threonine peptidase. MEROPS family T03 [Sphingopyxis indica]